MAQEGPKQEPKQRRQARNRCRYPARNRSPKASRRRRRATDAVHRWLQTLHPWVRIFLEAWDRFAG